MSDSRKRRVTEAKTYGFSDFSDDDDFAEFTPPTKKKKESKLSKNKCKRTPIRQPPKYLQSAVENQFQSDLQTALILSSQSNENENSSFQGFDTTEEKIPSLPDSFGETSEEEGRKSPLHDCNGEEVKKTPCGGGQRGPSPSCSEEETISCENKEKTPLQECNDKEAKTLSSEDEEDLKMSTLSRPRKKVNFESDESTGFSSEDSTISSEDESDFVPSPIKKKNTIKNTSKSVPKQVNLPVKKITKQVSPPSKEPINPVSLPSKKTIKLLPPSKELIKPVPPSKEITKPVPPFKGLKIKISPVKENRLPQSAKPVEKLSVKPVPDVKSSKASCTVTNTSRTSLVKSAFRSPAMNGVVQPWSSSGKESTLSPSGLRLGLSRRGNFKPLHPNLTPK